MLDGRRILVAESDYLIAVRVASEVTNAGGNVEMASSVDAALDVIANAQVDGAILDVELRGELTFRVADTLTARRIPFAFAAALSRENAPARYPNIPWLEKPVEVGAVGRVLDSMIGDAKIA